VNEQQLYFLSPLSVVVLWDCFTFILTFIPEDGGNLFSRNVRSHLPNIHHNPEGHQRYLFSRHVCWYSMLLRRAHISLYNNVLKERAALIFGAQQFRSDLRQCFLRKWSPKAYSQGVLRFTHQNAYQLAMCRQFITL
jgi:hypothetical protein